MNPVSRAVLLLLFLLLTATAHGQRRDPFVYVEPGIGAGAGYHGRIMLHLVYGKRHGLGIGYQSYWRKAGNLPADYRAGTLLNLAPNYPQQFLTGLALTYGYALHPWPERAPTMRLQLRAGALIGNHAGPEHYTPSGSGWRNYTTDKVDHPVTAFLFHPVLEYTPSRVFGLSYGLFTVVSPRFSSVGVSAGMLLGYVGDRQYIRQRKGRR